MFISPPRRREAYATVRRLMRHRPTVLPTNSGLHPDLARSGDAPSAAGAPDTVGMSRAMGENSIKDGSERPTPRDRGYPRASAPADRDGGPLYFHWPATRKSAKCVWASALLHRPTL